jgi:RNA polymerase sigma factor (sigma-70 family)
MATNALNRVIQHLRRAALRHVGATLTDGELLERYVTQRDDAAFEALMRRHGPMVLGACRRVLGNEADAEDAFQATFLVFVHKAASIRSRSTVSNWLYGVAHNMALKAKALNRKRYMKEREAASVPKHQARAEVWQEVQALLDAELSGLPDKYRVAIVLCDLEGKTIKEAARRLGWPQGTVATRLTRGRACLAKRLGKHGLTLSGAVVAALVSQGAALANMRTALIDSTIRAASMIMAQGKIAVGGTISVRVAALAEGMMKTMLLSKLKFGTTLALALALLGVGWGVYQTHAAGVAERPTEVVKAPGSDAPNVAESTNEERKREADDAKEWSLPKFDEITVRGNIKVLITLGATQRVTARGDAKLLHALRPRVEKKLEHDRLLLDVSLLTERESAGMKNVEIRVTVPRLSDVTAEGSAVVAIRAIRNEWLTLNVSDNATIEASGASQSLMATVRDFGQLDASRLACGHVSVTASGKSSGVFHPQQALNVLSSGDAHVEYRGTPAQLHQIVCERSRLSRR